MKKIMAINSSGCDKSIWFIKDKDLKYISCSAAYSELIKLREIEGFTDYDIPSLKPFLADKYREYELKLLLKKEKITTIEYYPVGVIDWTILITNRNIQIDIKTGEVLIFYTAVNVTDVPFFKKFNLFKGDHEFGINRNPISINLTLGSSPLNLSYQQQKCLYYLVRGKSAKEIASYMEISPRTVERHILIMKERLNCYSKSDLIEKAVDSGFFYFVPKDIRY